ncbi:hypothetical protein [Clostridium luticellarii]|jgi:hypothetical protein|uniref:Uncharacterized protein n=1 Tax=Clostridium luticellarii TaxID=1691940 RepID=A0A2T0B5Q6_9CLOT|nr:hypothetical protein [Clostridium luticellarii]PRR79127.1 hypothetical protein CLLU_35540 [Clostridium luticellarii]
MKLDIVNILQLILIFFFIAGFLSCILYSYKNDIKKVNYKLITCTWRESLKYSEGMTVDEYTVYEKYSIWRFFVYL